MFIANLLIERIFKFIIRNVIKEILIDLRELTSVGRDIAYYI